MLEEISSLIKLFWLTLFAIAMGYMESAIVVYLRELYYPNGFGFPLQPVPPKIAITEFWREAATIIMLGGVGMLTGKNRAQRLVFFLYCFAVWDIFYYVFLYVLVGWPQSLFTWDILFLIPVPWVGPVLCPCIVSLTMILLTFVTLHWQKRGRTARLIAKEKILFTAGSLVIIFSFIYDYIGYVNVHCTDKSCWSLSNSKQLFSEAMNYVPQHFDWWIFIAGQLVMLIAIFIFGSRMKNENVSGQS